MAINFSDPFLRRTYADRTASPGWRNMLLSVIGDASGLTVADIGCGGGIYSQAWLELGASRVIGIDAIQQFLDTATAAIEDDRFEVVEADAARTGLPDGSVALVFARALVHHLPDLRSFARECARILQPGGRVVIQDRTIDDVEQPAASDHPRGYFFAVHPRLLDVERRRRPSASGMSQALTEAAFEAVRVQSFWEERRVYDAVSDYQGDVAARTGRSILHELSDAELDQLIAALGVALPPGRVVERDRWTVWTATKSTAPAVGSRA